MQAGSGERGREWERERERVGREQEREGGVWEILVMISGFMQDGEYNREVLEAVAEERKERGRGRVGHTIFLVECNLQFFSCMTMMRNLITHYSWRFSYYPISSLTTQFTLLEGREGKEGR